ncbi:MAG: ATP-dependent helicase [Prevotella sp.]|nr:ATP-dependent helicase [Prevotella sp.]
MELTEAQKKVVYATEPQILCLSCAAAGKTATLVARINHLIDDMGADPSKIVAFTFTNQAADEMRRRITKTGQSSVQISTVHAYANKICHNAGIDTSGDIEDEEFDKIISRAILIAEKYYEPVDYLFVDEVQDTDRIQFVFFQKIPAKNRFYCGDDRQAIYGFKHKEDFSTYLRGLAKSHKWKKYYLLDNFRNPSNFIQYAEEFLHGMDDVLSPDATPHLPNGILEVGISIMEVLTNEITTPYEDWAFLCRTNENIVALCGILDTFEIPYVRINRGDFSSEGLEEVLKTSGKVKVMTIHSAKGLEFPNVVVIGAKTYNAEERRVCYVAATRAQKSLFWCDMRARKKKNKGNEKKIVQF